MELTATNRSQAYPKTEKGGCGYAKAEGSTKWFRTGERRHIEKTLIEAIGRVKKTCKDRKDMVFCMWF